MWKGLIWPFLYRKTFSRRKTFVQNIFDKNAHLKLSTQCDTRFKADLHNANHAKSTILLIFLELEHF